MKLLNSLFSMTSSEASEGTARYGIELNATHVIYAAHFPGQPVTPGVCLQQMAQELLEVYCSETLDLVHVKNVKFLKAISPMEYPCLTVYFSKINRDSSSGSVSAQALFLSPDNETLVKTSFTCRRSDL